MSKKTKPRSKRHRSPDLSRRTLLSSLTLLWLSMILLLPPFPGCSSSGDHGTPCTQNSQCPPDLKCIARHCGNGRTDSICRSNDDCLNAYLCENQRCRFGIRERSVAEATPDSDGSSEPAAPEEPLEASPEYSNTCRTQQDCPAGQYCVVTDDQKSARCTNELLRCQRSKGDCSRLEGTTCRLLRTNQGLSTLFCLYPYNDGQVKQEPGVPCQTHNACRSGICLRESKVCGAFCVKDSDCPNQFYCGVYTFFGQGDFKGCYPKCNSDADCSEGYRCNSDSQCEVKTSGQIGQPCRSREGDCCQGKACSKGVQCIDAWGGGYCTQKCEVTTRSCGGRFDPPCPANQTCNKSNGKCRPACPTKSACTMLSGAQALCLQTCQQDEDCRNGKGYYCDKTAGRNPVCLPRGEGGLGDSCRENRECRSGLCGRFTTGRHCTQRCPNKQCPAGFHCWGETPQVLCERDCLQDKSCPAGYRCLNQRCAIPSNISNRPIGAACTQNSHCQSQQCEQSTALDGPSIFPHGYCTAACTLQKQNCPTGTTCVQTGASEGRCVRSCQTDSDCQRSNYLCRSALLQNEAQRPITCSTEKPCKLNIKLPTLCDTTWTGSFCSIGLCVGRGERSSGQPCGSPSQCQAGLCYQAPEIKGRTCSTDKDCPSPERCDTSRQQCVQCTQDRECPATQSCQNGRCRARGLCTQHCQNTADCPTGTQCSLLSNSMNQSLGRMCLLECRSYLQCPRGFACRKNQDGQEVCTLP